MGNREHISNKENIKYVDKVRYRVAVSIYTERRFFYLLRVIFDYIERNKLNWKVSHENRKECQIIWVDIDNIDDIERIRSLLV